MLEGQILIFVHGDEGLVDYLCNSKSTFGDATVTISVNGNQH